MPVLIAVPELHQLLGTPRPPKILDVRWSLAVPDGLPAYRQGHLPGAVHVDLEADLSAHSVPTAGRHPLPATAGLQAAARGWGINDGDVVVVHDAGNSLAAARAWWVLTAAGITDVRILDGGLAAWERAGLPLETGDPTVRPGDVTLDSGLLPIIEIDEAAAFPAVGVLLDARAAERYRGESEPIDPRAGHIPGALSAPTADNLADDGTFLPVEQLVTRFESLGITADTPVAVYCGSGVTAAHQIAALTIAGRSARLYPGSWSQWSHHPDRPVATGPHPEGVTA